MILRLFYKACRLITYIVIIVAIILILSKLLPIAGDFADKIIHAVKTFFSGIERTLKNLPK